MRRLGWSLADIGDLTVAQIAEIYTQLKTIDSEDDCGRQGEDRSKVREQLDMKDIKKNKLSEGQIKKSADYIEEIKEAG